MSFALADPTISVQEYLDGEPRSSIRHEYIDGQVYAMAGAGENHNRITGNLFFQLRAATRGKPCGLFASDMKLRIDHSNSYYYPDVLLTCDPADTDAYVKKYPCLVAEVLSPATESIDRREKLLAYRALPTLQHYLLVAQDQRRVEWHSRDANGRWQLRVVEIVGQLSIDCAQLHVSFTLDDVYEDVALG